MINTIRVVVGARFDCKIVVAVLYLFAFSGCNTDVVGPNRKPVAVAGLDIVTQQGEQVELNADQSYDPDGEDITAYQWKLLSKPFNAIEDITDKQSKITRLKVDASGVWVVSLSVTDGLLISSPDLIRIYVNETSCLTEGSRDTDDDGICDDVDLDDDNDGWSDNDEAQCGTDPLLPGSVPIDSDGDGICQVLDQCSGDDSSGDIDEDNICNDVDEDDDADGWSDSDEIACGTDPNLSSSTPIDSDSDGVCNPLDQCTGVDALGDTDNDGICDDIDNDADGDGWSNDEETACGSDPQNTSSVPTDDDGDGVCNPQDQCTGDDASGDTDGDGVCDDIVDDDDGDGWTDTEEAACGTDPNQADSVPVDSDGDGICNALDQCTGIDTSGDKDGDGICNDVDLDDDGDGWSDAKEITCGTDPLIAASVPTDSDHDNICDSEDTCTGANNTGDTDNDGICNDQDSDDDNDTWTDAHEAACGSDPLLDSSVPTDSDGDGSCDALDLCTGDDSSGDTDSDGFCNDQDSDDDNDTWSDADEVDCGTDPLLDSSVPTDSDGDGSCDALDLCTGDDSSGDTDSDGVCNDQDSDDDNDTWSDADEVDCGTDPLSDSSVPADEDGDGICDALDPCGTDNDADDDGYIDLACGGDDCDDSDQYVNPGAAEGPVCATDNSCFDNKDNDCDGDIDSSDSDCQKNSFICLSGPDSISVGESATLTVTLDSTDRTPEDIVCYTDNSRLVEPQRLLANHFETNEDGFSKTGNVTRLAGVDGYQMWICEDGSALQSDAIDTRGKQRIMLSYIAWTDHTEDYQTNELLISEFSPDDGNTWFVLNMRGDGEEGNPIRHRHLLPPQAEDVEKLRIRFRMLGSTATNDCGIVDAVVVSALAQPNVSRVVFSNDFEVSSGNSEAEICQNDSIYGFTQEENESLICLSTSAQSPNNSSGLQGVTVLGNQPSFLNSQQISTQWVPAGSQLIVEYSMRAKDLVFTTNTERYAQAMVNVGGQWQVMSGLGLDTQTANGLFQTVLLPQAIGISDLQFRFGIPENVKDVSDEQGIFVDDVSLIWTRASYDEISPFTSLGLGKFTATIQSDLTGTANVICTYQGENPPLITDGTADNSAPLPLQILP